MNFRDVLRDPLLYKIVEAGVHRFRDLWMRLKIRLKCESGCSVIFVTVLTCLAFFSELLR